MSKSSHKMPGEAAKSNNSRTDGPSLAAAESYGMTNQPTMRDLYRELALRLAKDRLFSDMTAAIRAGEPTGPVVSAYYHSTTAGMMDARTVVARP